MNVGIMNIGDELLAGKILNTNQFELARVLAPLGHDIVFNLVVGDEEKALARALDWASSSGPFHIDLLILTGGLGPTRDDLTRQAVAAYLGREVAESPAALEWLCAFLNRKPEELPWGQRVQACVPQGSEPLRNPAGTACGFRFEAHGAVVYAFPGVPKELDAMMHMHLLPRLRGDNVLLERTAWTWGWSESVQREAFENIPVPEGFRFSSLPGERGVRLTLSCLCAPAERNAHMADLDRTWNDMLAVVPPESLIDREGATLPQAVQKLLLARKATVSVAESCTGGGLGVLLTETSGSSEVFQRGFLTYSNQAKIDLLGVDPEILNAHGAVSEETALAMVRGCLQRSGSSYAVAITGIAGPTGGTPEKPVGTVWIAVANRESAKAKRFHFRGDRSAVRSRSACSALNQLRLLISGQLP